MSNLNGDAWILKRDVLKMRKENLRKKTIFTFFFCLFCLLLSKLVSVIFCFVILLLHHYLYIDEARVTMRNGGEGQ